MMGQAETATLLYKGIWYLSMCSRDGFGRDSINVMQRDWYLGICSNDGAGGDGINGRAPLLHGGVQLHSLLHLPMAGVHVQQRIVGPQHVPA